jgi:predicted nucleic acid-binding protein
MICVDASVVAKRLIAEPYSDRVVALFDSTMSLGELIVASTLLPMEIANALRKQVVRKRMSREDAVSLLALFDALPISLHPIPEQHRVALTIADRFDLPAVYDACYLGVAQALGGDFWTDDQRLLHTLNGRLPFVRWIGDYEPTPNPQS